MKTANRMVFALAVVALLVRLAGAAVTAVSDTALLDTRSLSTVTDIEEQDLDTRSHTMDWSEARRLNTKEIVGTTIVVR